MDWDNPSGIFVRKIERIIEMTITFEINDMTSLVGDREQNVKIQDLNCSANEMGLAKHLTEVITKEVKEYINKSDKEVN